MEKAEAQRQSWWSRQSLFRRLLLICIPIIIIIGLAVGLGVGLTVGRDNADDDGDDSTALAATAVASAVASATPVASGVWQPAANTTWQIVLQNDIKLSSTATSVTPDVAVFDIDMFDNDKEVMDTLHKLGKKVICYFSAGSYEPDRPDSSQFKKSDMGKELDGWPGEYWLNISSPTVRSIMSARIATAQSKGCDAIDPDNVDGYDNDNGLGLTAANSIDYMKFLSSEASSRGMSCGLKNAGEIIKSVLPVIAFSVNEQCHEYQECSTFTPFITAGKPVFNIEYPDDFPKVMPADITKYCATSGSYGAGASKFSIALKDMDLDGAVEYCNGAKYTTPMDSS